MPDVKCEDDLTTAYELKDQGNKYFALHKYDDALVCYNRAISRNSSISTFYTNRSLCYIKMQQWSLAADDARRALELDPNFIKGHFFLGQALLEMDSINDAILYIQRAHDLAKEQKLNFGDEITYLLRVARKKRWNQMEEKRIKEEIELQTYLNGLIEQDKQRQLSQVRVQLGDTVEPEQVHEFEKNIIQKCDSYVNELNSMFEQLDIRRKKRDIPDYLCGKISFELLKDPVITPSGITYDRRDIEEHLQRVGHFDPVTRHPLTSDQLTPNLSMKEVVDSFLLENEWANDF